MQSYIKYSYCPAIALPMLPTPMKVIFLMGFTAADSVDSLR